MIPFSSPCIYLQYLWRSSLQVVVVIVVVVIAYGRPPPLLIEPAAVMKIEKYVTFLVSTN